MDLYQLQVVSLRKQEYLRLLMVVVTQQQLQELLAGSATPSAPTIIIIPASVTLGCNPSAADITAALGSATATAACSHRSLHLPMVLLLLMAVPSHK
jgi:hypothetical protein